MKRFTLMTVMLMSVAFSYAKTLVLYYSFTNNSQTIAYNFVDITGADIQEIEPSEEGLDYAANNYAIGRRLMNAINSNPNSEASYPAIKDVNCNLADYSTIIIAAPVWYAQMAAPMQTYLFKHGAEMAGKNIGLMVSSASSGISGVVSDAKRLVPGGNFFSENLWIRSYQTSNSKNMINNWLDKVGYYDIETSVAPVFKDNAQSIAYDGSNITLGGSGAGLAVYDMAGNLVLSSNGSSANTDNLYPGVYAVRAKGFSKKITVKANK